MLIRPQPSNSHLHANSNKSYQSIHEPMITNQIKCNTKANNAMFRMNNSSNMTALHTNITDISLNQKQILHNKKDHTPVVSLSIKAFRSALQEKFDNSNIEITTKKNIQNNTINSQSNKNSQPMQSLPPMLAALNPSIPDNTMNKKFTQSLNNKIKARIKENIDVCSTASTGNSFFRDITPIPKSKKDLTVSSFMHKNDLKKSLHTDQRSPNIVNNSIATSNVLDKSISKINLNVSSSRSTLNLSPLKLKDSSKTLENLFGTLKKKKFTKIEDSSQDVTHSLASLKSIHSRIFPNKNGSIGSPKNRSVNDKSETLLSPGLSPKSIKNMKSTNIFASLSPKRTEMKSASNKKHDYKGKSKYSKSQPKPRQKIPGYVFALSARYVTSLENFGFDDDKTESNVPSKVELDNFIQYAPSSQIDIDSPSSDTEKNNGLRSTPEPESHSLMSLTSKVEEQQSNISINRELGCCRPSPFSSSCTTRENTCELHDSTYSGTTKKSLDFNAITTPKLKKIQEMDNQLKNIFSTHNECSLSCSKSGNLLNKFNRVGILNGSPNYSKNDMFNIDSPNIKNKKLLCDIRSLDYMIEKEIDSIDNEISKERSPELLLHDGIANNFNSISTTLLKGRKSFFSIANRKKSDARNCGSNDGQYTPTSLAQAIDNFSVSSSLPFQSKDNGNIPVEQILFNNLYFQTQNSTQINEPKNKSFLVTLDNLDAKLKKINDKLQINIDSLNSKKFLKSN